MSAVRRDWDQGVTDPFDHGHPKALQENASLAPFLQLIVPVIASLPYRARGRAVEIDSVEEESNATESPSRSRGDGGWGFHLRDGGR